MSNPQITAPKLKFIPAMTRDQFTAFADALPTLGKRTNKHGKEVSIKRKADQCAFSVVRSNAGAHTVYFGIPKGATFNLFKSIVTGGESIKDSTFATVRGVWNDIEKFCTVLPDGYHAGTFNLTLNAEGGCSLGFRAGNAPVSKGIKSLLAKLQAELDAEEGVIG